MQAKRIRNTGFLVAFTLAVGFAAGLLAGRTPHRAHGEEKLSAPPRPHDPKTAEDEKAILANLERYIKAFNAGDARALAELWTEDGEFVQADGRSFRGRKAIQKELASLFTDSKGLKLEVNVDSLRFISPTVALESGTSRVSRPSDGASTVTSYHVVHSKQDGRWLLASVQESPHVPSSNYEQLRDLEWMIGTWEAKSGSKSLELSCEWAQKRSFILRKYSLKSAGEPTTTGFQVIGWDPVEGTIRSWTFDSDGGFGSERWTRKGKRWFLQATAVARDGRQATSTNILTLMDHDSFSWQSVSRSLGQARLPDTALIKATRVKTGK
jgi:uncharacterized protein (TIGR02246 family)